MKICAKCVLPETFPGIEFDESGVCNFCRRHQSSDDSAEKKAKARKKFEALVQKTRGTGGYDCLLSFSGGKDSTYTLWLLRKKYDLRVLAMTLDNAFMSPQSLENIRRVTESVDADHILIKPRFDLLRRLFGGVSIDSPYPAKALERASSVCNACMGLVKGAALRLALEQQIPIIAYGWSPGQAPVSASFFRMNPMMIRQMQQARMEPLAELAGNDLQPYAISDDLLSRSEMPYSVNPLAFFDYDEHKIIKKIRQLGWQQPTDTDGNSSNCLLNSFAIRLHLQSYGFHPYATEIAGLVREGILDREEGLAKLNDLGSSKLAESVAKALNVKMPGV